MYVSLAESHGGCLWKILRDEGHLTDTFSDYERKVWGCHNKEDLTLWMNWVAPWENKTTTKL